MGPDIQKDGVVLLPDTKTKLSLQIQQSVLGLPTVLVVLQLAQLSTEQFVGSLEVQATVVTVSLVVLVSVYPLMQAEQTKFPSFSVPLAQLGAWSFVI